MCFCLCTVTAGARSRPLASTFSTRSPAASTLRAGEQQGCTPRRLASSTGRCTAKPFSDRVSPFSFAPQASHRAGGPPLVTPSAALPSRVSLSPGPGGITRWQGDSAAPATRSKAGKYLALAPIENWLDSMRVNESIRFGLETRERPRPGEAPPAGLACSSATPLPEDEDRPCRVQFISCRAISTLTQERNMAPPFTLENLALSFKSRPVWL
jgi:hypothetical protein